MGFVAELSGPVLQPHAGSCHLREAASLPGTQHAYRTARAQQSILTRSAELRFREVFFSNPFGALRAGEVDAVTTWLPVREPDLTVGVVLREEPLHLVVAADHPLARQESVSMEVLGDHIVPRLNGSIPSYWETAVLPARTPAGRPVRRGPAAATFHEILALVPGRRRGLYSPRRGAALQRADRRRLPPPPRCPACPMGPDLAHGPRDPTGTRARRGGDGLRGRNWAVETACAGVGAVSLCRATAPLRASSAGEEDRALPSRRAWLRSLVSRARSMHGTPGSLGSFPAGDLGPCHRPLRAGSRPQSPPAHLLSQSAKSASYLVPMVSRSRLWAASYSPAR